MRALKLENLRSPARLKRFCKARPPHRLGALWYDRHWRRGGGFGLPTPRRRPARTIPWQRAGVHSRVGVGSEEILVIKQGRGQPDARGPAHGIAAGRSPEEQLLELTDLFERAGIGLLSLAPDGAILDANRAALDLLGYSSEDIAEKSIACLYADPDACQNVLAAIGNGDSLRHVEARVLTASGDVVNVLLDFAVEGAEDGAGPPRARCLIHDNRERKRAEEALRQSEQRWRRAAEAAQEGILITDAASRITFANERLSAMVGWRPEDGIGKDLADFLDTDAHAQIEERVARRRQGIAEQFDLHVRHRDGSPIWLSVSATPLFSSSGVYAGALSMITDVTAHRRIEETIRTRQTRYRFIANVVPGMIAVSNPAGNLEYWNRRVVDYTGLTEEQLRAGDVGEVFQREDSETRLKEWQDSFRNGEAVEGEVRLRRYDGVYRWHLGRVAPVRDDADQIVMWVATFMDIDDRRRAEESVRLSGERWRGLANAIPALVGTTAADGTPEQFNDRWYEFTGLPRGRLSYEQLGSVFHPDEVAMIAGLWDRAMKSGEPYSVEFRMRRADGAYCWHLAHIVPVRDEHGEVKQWISSSVDIDDRKQAEQALRESEQRFRQLADAMPQIVWAARPDGFVDYVNERWYMVTGGAAPVAGDEGWLPAIHPDDRERARAVWYACVRSGELYESEYRLLYADGRYRWHLARALPVFDDPGAIVRWFGTSTDIEDLKGAEQALLEESRVVETLQGIGVALTMELDLHKVAHTVIDSATQLTGAQFGAFFYNLFDEEGDGNTLYALSGAQRDVFGEFPLPHQTEIFAPTLSGKAIVRCEDVTADPRFGKNPPHYGWPEGHPPVKSYLAVPVIAHSGDVLGGLFFGHEEPGLFGEREERIAAGIAGWASVAVDNARLFEEAQRNALELKKANAAKDEFLGLVSHELKTPITTIYGNAEVLRRRLDRLDDESRVSALDDISNEAERLHRIIDNLLVLARLERGQEISSEPMLARRIVDRVVADHRRRFPHRTVRVEADENSQPITGEPVYVEQVVRNLLSNAEKYSPATEPIDVRIQAAGDMLEVSVLDRGHGFAAEEADLLFTPFYRSPATSDRAGGFGIGLAVCKRLIEAQAGTMWARQRPGGGSDIGFALRAADDTLDD